MENNKDNFSDFLFYQAEDGKVNVQVIIDNESETIWASQNSIAEILSTSKQTVSYHLNNIFREGELNRDSTVKEILTVQKEGKRDVQRNIEFYNLDVIISIGYRVNSLRATQFRKWATSVLREYLIKGFVLDDERLKQGNQLFGKDYFAEFVKFGQVKDFFIRRLQIFIPRLSIMIFILLLQKNFMQQFKINFIGLFTDILRLNSFN